MLTPTPTQSRRMIGYLRPYRGWVALALGARLLSSAMFLAMPIVIKSIVDSVLKDGSTADLNRAIALLMGVFMLLTVGTITGNYLVNYVGERVVMDLRRQLYAHLHTLSVRFFAERRVGELVSRMGSDVSVMRSVLTTQLITFLRHVMTITGGFIVMLALNWRLTLFILITMPLIVFLGVLMTRYSRRGGRQVQDELANATVIAEEAFHSVREVKSFVRADYEVRRYDAAMHQTLRAALRLVRMRALLVPLVHFLFLTNIALILWYGGREVLAGRLTDGALISFLVYVAIVGQMFADLSGLYTQLQETLGATQRVFELLDTPPDLQDAPDAALLDRVEGRITFEGVSFAYDNRQPVLLDVNLDIAPGEILALVGPSGAGKSTLFNLIPRFYDVTGGTLRIDGQDVRSVTQASLRAQIGIVPQETLLFGGTIRENILYGRLDASDEDLIAAAQAANAHEFIMSLPDGYATTVGERGTRLSGGQRQRVAIARAILKNPRILLLDEATSSLDNESELLVQEALERLMRDRTTVIIAHRLSTIRGAHRIAVLENGRIVELGAHKDLMARDGLYARLYDMQFRQQDSGLLALAPKPDPVPVRVPNGAHGSNGAHGWRTVARLLGWTGLLSLGAVGAAVVALPRRAILGPVVGFVRWLRAQIRREKPNGTQINADEHR